MQGSLMITGGCDTKDTVLFLIMRPKYLNNASIKSIYMFNDPTTAPDVIEVAE